MKVKDIYTSIACNRTPECADWGNNGLIVFGACNAVGIYDPKYSNNSARITRTFVRHTKRVNVVSWIRPNAPTKFQETLFLSGADDGLALLWDISKNPEMPKTYLMEGHISGVNAISGIYVDDNHQTIMVATAAADSTIKVWHIVLAGDDAIYEGSQSIMLQGGFCLALRLTRLPKSTGLLLAFSSDDESIELWTRHTGRSQFRSAHKLTGHEDWVRGLDFVQESGDSGDLLLASCGQDNFIRLWRISPRTAEEVVRNHIDIFQLIDENSGELRVEEKIFKFDHDAFYAVSLESVLYGHEGWVYGVHWHKNAEGALHLLSASIDKTLIVWEPTEDGVWMEKVRVGEVGGNSLGFFGGKFSHDGKSIFGHGFQGGFHIWNQSVENANVWTPHVIVGGHFGEVRDIDWEPKGEYLMSLSADQTTRIHAPWVRGETDEITWHELARPQVHGYDMQALAILTRYKFASGAEEKIVRTFQASTNFIENFRRLAKIEADEEGDALLKELPKGASVPSLGLSNKAVYNVETPEEIREKHVKDEYPENYFIPATLTMPPQEVTLMQNTLWPEVQKLYGHGYEIFALAASPDGQLLASSCKGTNVEHAQIILWNTTTWKQIQKLPSHNLTVIQLAFSPTGSHLLSVSRDRRWTLFGKNPSTDANATPTYTLEATTDKNNGVHTRIIWSCDWSHDGKYFATTSREGKLVVWGKKEEEESTGDDSVSSLKSTLNGWHALDTLELKNESITAVAFAKHSLRNGSYIVALGLERGSLKIYEFGGKLHHVLDINNEKSHHLTVKRLRFRPKTTGNALTFQLASCGEDHFVRIYELSL